MLYTTENRDDLERLILHYLSEPKQNGESEYYTITWDAAATVLKTADRAELVAWTNSFADRGHLICSPALNGVNFSLITHSTL